MGKVTKIIHKKNGVKSIIDFTQPVQITQNIYTNSQYNIGEYKESKVPLSDNETLDLMDGRILSNNGHELLFNHIREILKTHPELFTDINSYNNEVSETGECHKFVYQSFQENDDEYSLKLPTYNNTETYHYICTKLKNTNVDKNIVKAEVKSSYQIDPELSDTYYLTLTDTNCHISMKQPTNPDLKYEVDVYFYQSVGDVTVTFDQNVRGIQNDEIKINHARDYVSLIKLTSMTGGNFWMFREIATWYGAIVTDVLAPQYEATLAFSFLEPTDWGYYWPTALWGGFPEEDKWAIPINITFTDAYNNEKLNLKHRYRNQFIIGSRDLYTDSNYETLNYTQTPSASSQQQFDQYEMLETDVKGYYHSYQFPNGYGYGLDKIATAALSKNYYLPAGSSSSRKIPCLDNNYDFIKPSTIYYTLFTNKPFKNITFQTGNYLYFAGARAHVGFRKVKADLYYDGNLVKTQIIDIPVNSGVQTYTIDCSDLVTDWQKALDKIEAENAEKLRIAKSKSYTGTVTLDKNEKVEIYRYVEESGNKSVNESGNKTETNKVLTKIYSLEPGSTNDCVLRYDDIIKVQNLSAIDDIAFIFSKSTFKNELNSIISGNALSYKKDGVYEFYIHSITNEFTLTFRKCQGPGSFETDNTTFIRVMRGNDINKFIGFNELTYFDDLEVGDVIVPSKNAVLKTENCQLVETEKGSNNYIVSTKQNTYKINASKGELSSGTGKVIIKDNGTLIISDHGSQIFNKNTASETNVKLTVGDMVKKGDSVLALKDVNLYNYDNENQVVTFVADDFELVSQDNISNISDTSKALTTNNLKTLLTNADRQVQEDPKVDEFDTRLDALDIGDYKSGIINNVNNYEEQVGYILNEKPMAEMFGLADNALELFGYIKNDAETEIQNKRDNYHLIDEYNDNYLAAEKRIDEIREIQDKFLDSRYKAMSQAYTDVINKFVEMKTTDNLDDVVTDLTDMINSISTDINQYENLHSDSFDRTVKALLSNITAMYERIEGIKEKFNYFIYENNSLNVETIKRELLKLRKSVTESGNKTQESGNKTESGNETLTQDDINRNTAIENMVIRLSNYQDSMNNSARFFVSETENTFNERSGIYDSLKDDITVYGTNILVDIDNIKHLIEDNKDPITLIQTVGTYDAKYTDKITTETGVNEIDLTKPNTETK